MVVPPFESALDETLIAAVVTELSEPQTDGTIGFPLASTGDTLMASPDCVPTILTAFLDAGTALTLLESTIVVEAVPVTVALELDPFATVLHVAVADPTVIVAARNLTPIFAKPVLLKAHTPFPTALLTAVPPPFGFAVSAFHVTLSVLNSNCTVPVQVPASVSVPPAALNILHASD